MKVILTERVQSVGNVGEMVDVSSGYARNFLFPKKLALLANENNKRQMDHEAKQLEKKIQEHKTMAEGLKGKLSGLDFVIYKRVSGSGQLFGTVTSLEIAKLLNDKDFSIEKRQVVIDRPIKGLGEHDVKLKLFEGVETRIKVNVLIDPKQAEEEEKRKAKLAKKKSSDAADAAAAAAAAEAAAGESSNVSDSEDETEE